MNRLIEKCIELTKQPNELELHFAELKKLTPKPTQLKQRNVICYGAGTDSTIAAYLTEDPLLLWCNYGQEYAHKEEKVCEHMVKQGFDLIKLKINTIVPQGYIFPARNLLLSAYATLYGNNITIAGTWRGEGAQSANDKCPYFYENVSRLFTRFYQDKVTVDSPFSNDTRTDTFRKLIKLKGINIATKIIQKTSTCYSPKHNFCGECNSCYKRYIAEKLVGIEQKYKINPFETDYFWDKAIYKELSYGEKRYKELFQALQAEILDRHLY